MSLDPRLLDILCCPAEAAGVPCHGVLEERGQGLLCRKCGLHYPIVDGIPVMLPDQASRKEER
nr:Trm112 family protein [uncultured Holophaga sp.]